MVCPEAGPAVPVPQGGSHPGMEDDRLAAHQKGAFERGAKVVFLDESGFSTSPHVRRTWAPRGETPVLRHKLRWERVHAVGMHVCTPVTEAEIASEDVLLHLQEAAINADSLQVVLTALHAQVPGPIILLWDRLPVHLCKAVKAFRADNEDWLAVELFPVSAPELNPPEYLWSALKGKDLANFCPDTREELTDQVLKGYGRLRADPRYATSFLAASSLGRMSPLVM